MLNKDKYKVLPNIPSTKIEAILEGLKNDDPQYTALDFSSYFFREGELEKISSLLKFNTTVKKLKIKNFTGNSFKTLLSDLVENTHLLSLDLSGEIAFSFTEIKQLSEFSQKNWALRELILDGRQISERLGTLIGGLQYHQNLMRLSLKENAIKVTETGLESITRLLATVPLTHLDLESNSLNDANSLLIEQFTETILTKSSLVYLNLANNQVGNNWINSLCKILKKPFSAPIGYLNLENNSFGSRYMNIVSEMLKENSSLASLLLANNLPESNDFINPIVSTFNQNQNCSVLNLSLPNKVGFPEKRIQHNQGIFRYFIEYIQSDRLENIKHILPEKENFFSYPVSLLGTIDSGNTALHIALMKGSKFVTEYIIQKMQEKKIPLHIPNDQLETPYDFAIKYKRAEFLELLPKPFSPAVELKPPTSSPAPLPKVDASNNNNDTSISSFIKVHIDTTQILGEGGFGTVYKAFYYGAEVAVKVNSQILDDDSKNVFLKEVSIMKRLSHPYIVHFYGVCQIENRYGIVMEKMICSLGHALYREYPLSLNHYATKIARGVLWGLSYLHANNILHRDLKSYNVLLANDFTPSLTDFGISKDLNHSKTTTTQSIRGTTNWIPPEVFQGKAYQEKSDVYGYGMILFEITAKKVPFSDCVNPHILGAQIIMGKRPTFPSGNPRFFVPLIEKCWAQEPEERPTLDEAREMLEEIISANKELRY